ncbi:MAG: hypothetical protein E7506_03505 [Ruminococcus sp.]|nr:hypothetical protein [Ruminococcus sp.]
MSYYGELYGFSLRDNICEETVGKSFSDITDFFSKAPFKSGTIAVGYGNNEHKSCAYSISVGVAEHGNDALIFENCILPSFMYTIKELNITAGIYIKRINPLVISFFDSFGMPLSSNFLFGYSEKNNKNGEISSFNQADLFYLRNLQSITGKDFSASASISCANSITRNIWKNFFVTDSDALTFQVASDGSAVNAYSDKLGFISHEKLMIACAVCLMKRNICPVLPDYVHFIADELADRHNSRILRYSASCSEEISLQRFTADPLYMCITLMSQEKDFISVCNEVPGFYTAKREIITENCNEKDFFGTSGKISITHSGKNRITVAAQAYKAETASELCCNYIDSLKIQPKE